MKVALLALCLFSAEAPSFDTLVQQGLQAYGDGRYEAAASDFLQAFSIRAEPELVFNAARSYEKGLRTEAAIEQYERFLGLQGTTAALRSRALESLRGLRSELKAKQAPPASAPAPAPPTVAPSARSTAPPTSLDRAPEIVLLSVGGASLVAGTVFGLLALDAKNDFDDADPIDPARVDFRADARDNALLADVFFAAGGVSVATGIILFFVRRPQRDTQARLPNLGFDGRTLSLSGRF